MKKVLLFLFMFLTLITPTFVRAEEKVKEKYNDKLYEMLEIKESEKVRIYFFHSKVCSHCIAQEHWLHTLEKKYKDKIEIIRYQVYKNETNSLLMKNAKEIMGETGSGVPFTVIGNKSYLGFADIVKEEMYNDLEYYINDIYRTEKNIKLPFVGEVDLDKMSLPIVAIILGTLDGFNPCAMWILLFLINMLFNMKDRKKMWILGLTFLFTSAFVYFLAMLGLSVVLGYTQAIFIQKIIAAVAIIGGIVNLNSYRKTKDDGCHVVDSNKRKKYFNQIKKFTTEKNLGLALVGVIVLAASVNLVELACSAGFPAIYVSMLELNNVGFISKVLYLLLYITFFLVDDIIVFVVAMKTLEVSGITTKYNKLSHLIGGIIMILIGLLLIFKPEWIMLNF